MGTSSEWIYNNTSRSTFLAIVSYRRCTARRIGAMHQSKLYVSLDLRNDPRPFWHVVTIVSAHFHRYSRLFSPEPPTWKCLPDPNTFFAMLEVIGEQWQRTTAILPVDSTVNSCIPNHNMMTEWFTYFRAFIYISQKRWNMFRSFITVHIYRKLHDWGEKHSRMKIVHHSINRSG